MEADLCKGRTTGAATVVELKHVWVHMVKQPTVNRQAPPLKSKTEIEPNTKFDPLVDDAC